MWVKIKQYFVNPYGSHQMVIPLAIPVSAFQALNLPVLGNNMEDSEMVLFLLLSDVITKPLLSIIANIAANRRIKKPAKYQDEIGILINTLNQMYDTIDRQIETIRQQAEMVRTAEMQALSQQINPHFLYNVLDSTRWKILAEDKAAATIIEELSAFLRISLNQGKAELTLETEIRHIELYLRIMDQIENHRIELVVDCAEELKKMKIIHLILQPLVENSIKHGFREPFPETIAKCIIIRLAVSSDRNHLVLEVTDNGQGMDTTKMEKACTPLQEQGSGGIGLTNVYLRLCRYYNQAIRAEFLSIPYVKNTVRFYLPSGPDQEA